MENDLDEQFRHGMSSKEKVELRSKILRSIRAYKIQRTVRLVTSMAAVLVILAGISYFYYFNASADQMPQAYQFAVNSSFDESTNVVLQLGDAENVEITQENSVIEHSSDDSDIKIGNTRTIKRQASNEINYNTLIVPYGKRSEILLSDGTKVWLNSGSKLVYPSLFSEEKREVYLIGEAIFEVFENKDAPFYVTTNDYTVKVLGTVFNISNYPDDQYTSTVLKSGLVQINYKSKGLLQTKKSFEILPGTKVVYERNLQELSTSTVTVDTYFLWKEGKLIFKNDPLEHILKKVSRYYNVEVVIENEKLKMGSFSGYLNLREDISQVIDIINESIEHNIVLKREEGKNRLILN